MTRYVCILLLFYALQRVFYSQTPHTRRNSSLGRILAIEIPFVGQAARATTFRKTSGRFVVLSHCSSPPPSHPACHFILIRHITNHSQRPSALFALKRGVCRGAEWDQATDKTTTTNVECRFELLSYGGGAGEAACAKGRIRARVDTPMPVLQLSTYSELLCAPNAVLSAQSLALYHDISQTSHTSTTETTQADIIYLPQRSLLALSWNRPNRWPIRWARARIGCFYSRGNGVFKGLHWERQAELAEERTNPKVDRLCRLTSGVPWRI